jgi:hypothetical protein
MPISASGLVSEIMSNFPPEWDYSIREAPNRRWLDAVCSGFVAMWISGSMSLGSGPPPDGVFPHTHLLLDLPSGVMSDSSRFPFRGKDGVTDIFIKALSDRTSQFLTVNTVMSTVSGGALHIHQFTSFGNPDSLVSAISRDISLLRRSGEVIFNVGQSALPQWLRAFSRGVIFHLLGNASMVPAVGSGHTHILQ